MTTLDASHDPQTRSWVESANHSATDFPIQNLPLCAFRRMEFADDWRIGVGIGDQILDLHAAGECGLLEGLPPDTAAACARSDLNALGALGRGALRSLRQSVAALLAMNASGKAKAQALLLPQAQAAFRVPCAIGDYSDFFSSLNHALNTFRIFRGGGGEFLPNFKHLPIAYHGRASSIVASGSPVWRPNGQFRPAPDAPPIHGATRRLDFEFEIGMYIGCGNAAGSPIPIVQAEEHVLGLCIVNDWSARDIQAWESQPLGPFLGKSFRTSVSPWVVTLDALAPFRVAPAPRAEGDPAPLPYLDAPEDRAAGGVALRVETLLQTRAMRDAGLEPTRITHADFGRDVYWTLAQMLAHHTVNGCNLQPGDLIASGTVSGRGEGTQGCLVELTNAGTRPIALPNGESRAFLEDGDEVVMRAWCERDGFRRIGLGECRGVIVGAGRA